MYINVLNDQFQDEESSKPYSDLLWTYIRLESDS